MEVKIHTFLTLSVEQRRANVSTEGLNETLHGFHWARKKSYYASVKISNLCIFKINKKKKQLCKLYMITVSTH